MNIGFIIFNGMTTLDFIGFYDPITRIKTMGVDNEIQWNVCSFTDEVSDSFGLGIKADIVRSTLSEYDMVFIPGGFGTRNLIKDTDFINWIKTANACKLKVSVCTGALILGEAGFLKDKAATTHQNAFKELEKYCRIVEDRRVVDEGDIITARGVSSSIDLGLYVCERFYGREIREKIQRQMDYQGMSL